MVVGRSTLFVLSFVYKTMFTLQSIGKLQRERTICNVVPLNNRICILYRSYVAENIIYGKKGSKSSNIFTYPDTYSIKLKTGVRPDLLFMPEPDNAGLSGMPCRISGPTLLNLIEVVIA